MHAAVVDWKSPDYRPIFLERKARIDALRSEPRGWGTAWTYYGSHPIEAIEDWLFTFDPRLIPRKLNPYLPFVLFPRQRECVEWLHDLYFQQDEGIVEKSRDMGVTWICMAFSWWLWTFHANSQIGWGSRKKDEVDQIGVPKSLFGKFRILMRRLPNELKPLGWDEDQHGLFMKISNPENGSMLIGESGEEIGRGGRSSVYFIDEAAFLEYPSSAEGALSENTPCKIWISTPNRPGDWFATKVKGGRLKTFRFHWRDDPRKDDGWYADRCRRLEPEVVAREIDLDYDAGVSNLAIPAMWVRSSQNLHEWLEKRGWLPPIEKGEGIAALDVGDGGDDSVLAFRCGPRLIRSTSWNWDDLIDSAHRAVREALAAGCGLLNFDSVGLGRGTVAALRRQSLITARGVNGGDKASSEVWPDGKRSQQKFRNRRAELWWKARERLKYTHDLWLQIAGAADPSRLESEAGRDMLTSTLEECLLIPPSEARIARELSLPTYDHTEAGKIQIESKRAMRSRGIKSPDGADAFVMSLAKFIATRRPNRTVGL